MKKTAARWGRPLVVRGIAALATGALLAAPVTACSKKSDGASGPTVSASTTTSPTTAPSSASPPSSFPKSSSPTTPASSESEPTDPKPTAAGAIKVAGEFIQGMNELYGKQDPTKLREIGPGCLKCGTFEGAIRQKANAGYTFSGGAIYARGPSSFLGYNSRLNKAQVQVPVSTAALEVTDPSGHPYVSESDPAGGGPAYPHDMVTLTLAWLSDGWLVIDFTVKGA